MRARGYPLFPLSPHYCPRTVGPQGLCLRVGTAVGQGGYCCTLLPSSCPARNLEQNKIGPHAPGQTTSRSNYFWVKILASKPRQSRAAPKLGSFEEQRGLGCAPHSFMRPLVFISTNTGPILVIKGGKSKSVEGKARKFMTSCLKIDPRPQHLSTSPSL